MRISWVWLRRLADQFLLFLLILLLLLSFPHLTLSQSKTGVAYDTKISAFVGEYQFTLFGYTSPQALVTISGLAIFDQTYADEVGYFIFENRFSPFAPTEPCLTAQDVLGRLSSPLCLPPFPTNYNVSIGPVIVPPTVSVDVGEYYVGDAAYLSGQTVPQTEVDLSFFVASTTSLKLIGLAEAFSLPELKARSDKKGNFSISLPTNHPSTLRTFARTNYLDSLSAKSVTLNIKVLPWWMIVIKIFTLIISLLKDRLLELVILLQVLLVAYLLIKRFFHPGQIAKTRALMLRPPHSLEETGDFQTG